MRISDTSFKAIGIQMTLILTSSLSLIGVLAKPSTRSLTAALACQWPFGVKICRLLK